MKLYGALVAVPTSKPFAKNSTLVTVPSASLAVAAIGIVAGEKRDCPELGDVRVTVGAEFGVTAMEMPFDVATPRALSVARAVNEYVPAATLRQVAANGAVVAVPTRVPLARNSTFEIVPSLSLAVARSVMSAGAANDAFPAGAVNETVGGAFGSTVTRTDAEVDEPLRSSVATATRE
jgi:hypothetical protein